jgi:hypothetical protein
MTAESANIPDTPPPPHWRIVLLVVRLIIKGALFAPSPVLFGLAIGHMLRPNPAVDESFYRFVVIFCFAGSIAGALFYPLHLRTLYGRNRYGPQLIEFVPKLLTKGWVYPVTAIITCVLGGALFFYITTPDPKSSPLAQIVAGAFFTPVLGFTGLAIPGMFAALREEWKLSAKNLTAGAVIVWVLAMLASHPWTVETKVSPVITTIVIGLLAAVILAQYKL